MEEFDFFKEVESTLAPHHSGIYTREALKALQAQNLDEKIDHTLSVIEMFYMKTNGQVYLSFSGGKDSTVLKHLIEVEYPRRGGKLIRDVPCVFSDTGLEYPEVRKFAKEQGAEIIRPKMNFLEVLRKYGYPLISKAVSDCVLESRMKPGGSRWKRLHGEAVGPDGKPSMYNCEKYLPLEGLPIKISKQCCAVLKKSPFASFKSKTGLSPITATTAQESLLRTSAWVGTGCNAFDGKGGGKSNPMSAWLEQDVLHYIKREDLQISSVYGDVVYTDPDGNDSDMAMDFDMPLHCTGCDRTGCIFCTFGMHLEKGETRYQRLKETHPRLYEYALSGGEWEKENGKEFWMPNKKGLGFAKVFDMVNDIYGKDFYRYE